MMNAESKHDIPFDSLKALLQQLETECKKLPSNKPEFWQECEQEARAELLKKAKAEARKKREEEKKQAKIAEDEAKKKAALIAQMSGTASTGSYGRESEKKEPDTKLNAKPKRIKIPEPSQFDIFNKTLEIRIGANRKYLQENLECYTKINELLKDIDHTLLPTHEQRLLAYDRARKTLLGKDWQKIRNHFTRAAICDFSPMELSQTIEALEIIKADLDLHEKPEPPTDNEQPIEPPGPEPPDDKGGEYLDDKINQACTHSPDFRHVTWYGKHYIFNKNRATAIKLLWEAHEDPEKIGVHERDIGKALDTVSVNYRLIQTFRQRSKGKKGFHPAWKEMVEHIGTGLYRMRIPKQENTKS